VGLAATNRSAGFEDRHIVAIASNSAGAQALGKVLQTHRQIKDVGFEDKHIPGG